MFGRLAAFVATVMAVLLMGGNASAASYGNQVGTSCNVNVGARANRPISAMVDVKGNASDTVHGTVTITVTGGTTARAVRTARAARTVWSTSVRYDGSPVRVSGPALPAGHYRAVASFSADPGVYLDTQCSAGFGTRAVADFGGGNNGSGGGGGLPNTGGPSQWWLVLGFGLVLAGGASVYGSRHRKVAA